MTKTYAQLAKEIQALQAQAEALRKAETQGVIAKLNESIARYGLSVEDLHFPGNGASSSNSSASASGAKGRSGASSRAANASSDDAKYSDGPGRVWGGRGPRPAWLREAMAQGRSLESFAVTRKTRRAADASTPAKVSLPPLYSHPKTSQTWSGCGPKPAWLKQGLKRRGASIDDFLISARESNAESAPIDATQTAAPQRTASARRVSTSKGANTTQAKTSDKAVAKTPAQKTGKRTQDKANPQATPTATPASPATAPVKKAANGKSARVAGSAPSSTQTAAPAKKAAAPAKAQTDKGRKAAKPPVKKAAPARKNVPASMAPPPEMPTPAPSIEPTAAPVVSPTQPDAPSAPDTTSTP